MITVGFSIEVNNEVTNVKVVIEGPDNFHHGPLLSLHVSGAYTTILKFQAGSLTQDLKTQVLLMIYSTGMLSGFSYDKHFPLGG